MRRLTQNRVADLPTVLVRVSPELIEALDRRIETLARAHAGARFSRSSVAERILHESLLPPPVPPTVAPAVPVPTLVPEKPAAPDVLGIMRARLVAYVVRAVAWTGTVLDLDPALDWSGLPEMTTHERRIALSTILQRIETAGDPGPPVDIDACGMTATRRVQGGGTYKVWHVFRCPAR